MRSAAQMVSCEIAMGFSLICVLMVSNSLNLVDSSQMVQNTGKNLSYELRFGSIFLGTSLPTFSMFIVYLISGTAELNPCTF